MFLSKVFKGIGKRLIRDLLRYGSIWLLLVGILIIHLSGIIKFQFIDHLFDGDSAVAQLGNSIAAKVAPHSEVISEIERMESDINHQVIVEDNETIIEVSSENIQEDVFLIYEDGEYRSYNE